MEPIIDPRRGDFEDDASSTKRRSLLSLAGSLLVEISLPKLALAWFLMLVLPSLLLGLAPLAISAWLNTVTWKLTYSLADIWPAVILVAVIALGWFGGRPLLRAIKSSFWSLNALAVEPCDSPPLSDSGGDRIMVPVGGPKDERARAGSAASLAAV